MNREEALAGDHLFTQGIPETEYSPDARSGVGYCTMSVHMDKGGEHLHVIAAGAAVMSCACIVVRWNGGIVVERVRISVKVCALKWGRQRKKVAGIKGKESCEEEEKMYTSFRLRLFPVSGCAPMHRMGNSERREGAHKASTRTPGRREEVAEGGTGQ